MKRISLLALGLVLMLFTLGSGTDVAIAGTPPNIIPAHWNLSQGCADIVYPATSLETYTWKTLAGEWYDSWPSESLRAGSAIIRSNGEYRVNNPTDGLNCPGVSGFWNTSTAEQNYLHSATSSGFPNTYYQSNYIKPNGISPEAWYYYSNCTQNTSASLADDGWTYQGMITDATSGLFSQAQVDWCKAYYSEGQTYLQPYSGLSIQYVY